MPRNAKHFVAMGDYIDGVMKRCLGFLIPKAEFLKWLDKEQIKKFSYDVEEILERANGWW